MYGSRRIQVSALTGEGLDALVETAREACFGATVTRRLELSPRQSRLRARLFALRAVTGERINEAGGWTLDVELTSRGWRQLCAQEGLLDDGLLQET